MPLERATPPVWVTLPIALALAGTQLAGWGKELPPCGLSLLLSLSLAPPLSTPTRGLEQQTRPQLDCTRAVASDGLSLPVSREQIAKASDI